jgi:peptidase M24-like protein
VACVSAFVVNSADRWGHLGLSMNSGADPRHPRREVVDFESGVRHQVEIGERVIVDGDMIVLDFGGLKYGYGSDTTRTVHVGEPTAEEREVHDGPGRGC